MTQTTEDPTIAAAVPEATDLIVKDMVEGVRRYFAIAKDSTEQAEKYRQMADSQDESAVEYRAKGIALSGVMRDLGYDPETGERLAAGTGD